MSPRAPRDINEGWCREVSERPVGRARSGPVGGVGRGGERRAAPIRREGSDEPQGPPRLRASTKVLPTITSPPATLHGPGISPNSMPPQMAAKTIWR